MSHTATRTTALNHRIAHATVTVTAERAPLAHQRVVVAQRSHAFRFGNIGFELVEFANGELSGTAVEHAQRLTEHWFGVFNFAQLAFYPGGCARPASPRPLVRRVQLRHAAFLLGPVRAGARPARYPAAAAGGELVHRAGGEREGASAGLGHGGGGPAG